jgi:hypothetical protein
MSSSSIEIRPLAQNVIVTDSQLVVELLNGRRIAVPLVLFPSLLHAPEEHRQQWEILGDGEGIHWSAINEDLSVAGLLKGTPAVAQREVGA